MPTRSLIVGNDGAEPPAGRRRRRADLRLRPERTAGDDQRDRGDPRRSPDRRSRSLRPRRPATSGVSSSSRRAAASRSSTSRPARRSRRRSSTSPARSILQASRGFSALPSTPTTPRTGSSTSTSARLPATPRCAAIPGLGRRPEPRRRSDGAARHRLRLSGDERQSPRRVDRLWPRRHALRRDRRWRHRSPRPRSIR